MPSGVADLLQVLPGLVVVRLAEVLVRRKGLESSPAVLDPLRKSVSGAVNWLVGKGVIVPTGSDDTGRLWPLEASALIRQFPLVVCFSWRRCQWQRGSVTTRRRWVIAVIPGRKGRYVAEVPELARFSCFRSLASELSQSCRTAPPGPINLPGFP